MRMEVRPLASELLRVAVASQSCRSFDQAEVRDQASARQCEKTNGGPLNIRLGTEFYTEDSSRFGRAAFGRGRWTPNHPERGWKTATIARTPVQPVCGYVGIAFADVFAPGRCVVAPNGLPFPARQRRARANAATDGGRVLRIALWRAAAGDLR